MSCFYGAQLIILTFLLSLSRHAHAALFHPRHAALGRPEFVVNRVSSRLIDTYGRERVFHGLNVVVKGPPWRPKTDHFDSKWSFSDEDVSFLSSWGMNVIRLGIMWPGVEPERNKVDLAYLDVMIELVNKLHIAGIHTLLEFHQDIFSSRLCGEGVPSWLFDDVPAALAFEAALQGPLERRPVQDSVTGSVLTGGNHGTSLHHPYPGSLGTYNKEGKAKSMDDSNNIAKEEEEGRKHYTSPASAEFPCCCGAICERPGDYAANFPEPLGRPYRSASDGKAGGQIMAHKDPTEDQCLQRFWGDYHFTFAVARAFQDLYSNKWGWADLFATYWATVARAFRNQSGILGYELINEPWVGDQFHNPLLLLPKVADRANFLPLYDQLQAAIRAQDPHRLIFFEPLTFDTVGNGFSRVPGGQEYANMSVLSYHFYRPPNLFPEQTFQQQVREAKRLQTGLFLTEFGILTPASSNWLSSRASNRRLENLQQQLQGPAVAGASERQAADSSAASTEINNVRQQASGQGLQGGQSSSGLMDEVKLGRGSRKLSSWKGGNLRSVVNRPAASRAATAAGGEGQGSELHQREDRANSADGISLDVDPETVVEGADRHLQSWIGWEYKPYVNKTGYNLGPFNEDGSLNETVARFLSRTYPQAVAGTTCSFSFSPATGLFKLSYDAAELPDKAEEAGGAQGEGQELAEAEARLLSRTTEIWLSRKYFYPLGIVVSRQPPGLEVVEDGNRVLLRHSRALCGRTINIEIRPRT